MDKRINIVIEQLEDGEGWLAWPEGDNYRGMVERGESAADALGQLAISLQVRDDYHKNNLL